MLDGEVAALLSASAYLVPRFSCFGFVLENGSPSSLQLLAAWSWLLERNNNNYVRAVKHWIISSALGLDDSNKELMNASKVGRVSKDDLASALRAHQAAVDAMKSPQREAEEVEFYKNSNSVE